MPKNSRLGECRGTVVALSTSHRFLCEVRSGSYRTPTWYYYPSSTLLTLHTRPPLHLFQSALQFLQVGKLGVGWRKLSFVRRGIRCVCVCVCHTTKAWLNLKERRTDARECQRRVARLFFSLPN